MYQFLNPNCQKCNNSTLSCLIPKASFVRRKFAFTVSVLCRFFLSRQPVRPDPVSGVGTVWLRIGVTKLKKLKKSVTKESFLFFTAHFDIQLKKNLLREPLNNFN